MIETIKTNYLKNKKLFNILGIVNLATIIFCGLIQGLSKDNFWWIWVVYICETFSTITFQLRIYWTGKGKIYAAAVIGAISWCAAIYGVIGGVLYSDADIFNTHAGELGVALIYFTVTGVPTFTATFSGIAILEYKKPSDKEVLTYKIKNFNKLGGEIEDMTIKLQCKPLEKSVEMPNDDRWKELLLEEVHNPRSNMDVFTTETPWEDHNDDEQETN